MSEKQPIKVGDSVTLICDSNYKGRNKSDTVIKILRRYDPKTCAGYNRICCTSGIYDERDGRCIAGSKAFKLQINKD